MAFNNTRFANFAKYDLTINKTFYTSISLVTLIGTMAISFISFTGRYSMWKAVVESPWYEGGSMSPLATEHYNTMHATCSWILGFLCIMMCIFAGCWAHNLRDKQGRITELTLPATNLEKFTWHSLLMIGGGFLTCLASLLAADLLNAGLTACFCGLEDGIASITAGVGKTLSIYGILQDQANSIGIHMDGMDTDIDNILPEAGVNFFCSLGCFTVCYFIMQVAFYMFGNAVKYKYNIIFTYIATQIIGFIVGIGSIIIFATNADLLMNNAMGTLMEGDEAESATQFFTNIATGLYIASPLIIILAGFFVWLSYRLYTKAQITSALNK